MVAGRTEDALRLFEVVNRDQGSRDFVARSMPAYLPDLAYRAGRSHEALDAAVDCLRWAVGGGTLNICWAALDVAGFLIGVGEVVRGVRLLGAAEAYGERAGVTGRPSFMDQRIRERTAEAAAALGAKTYEEILEDGRRLDWDVALGLTLVTWPGDEPLAE